MLRRLNAICRDYLLVGVWPASAFVAVLGLAGAAVGLAFPNWTAEGLLETPGVLAPFAGPREREDVNAQEPPSKRNHVTLAEFRKAAAAYSSYAALAEYLSASKRAETPAGQRLLAQAERPAFWASVASPVLPFSRRDAREFGDLKDAVSDALVGIDIVTDARTPDLAIEMLGLMSGYYVNGVVRERVRTWVLRNRGEAPTRQKAALAEIVEAQMKIDTMGRRIQDLKAILARYPDSARIDARQVVSITEGSDRFLSPLVQLVAAETSITQLKETIARKERQARQADLVERYFAQAEEKLRSTPLSSDLVSELSGLAAKRFEGVDPEADWAKEVVLRIQAEIAGFSSAMTSFGIRNEPRASEVPWRDPARLAAFGIVGGLLLLGLVAFFRASLKARADAGEAEA